MHRLVSLGFVTSVLFAGAHSVVAQGTTELQTAGNCSPVVNNVTGDVEINIESCQLDPTLLRELAETVRQLNKFQDDQLDRVERLAGELGVTKTALQTFFRIVGEADVDVADYDAKLREVAARHLALLARLEQVPADEGDEIEELKSRARAAIVDGDYNLGESLLAEAEDSDLCAAQVARREADEKFLRAADTRAERGELQLTQLNYAGAAEHFAAAVELVPTSAPEARARYLNDAGSAFQDAGTYVRAEPYFEEALDIRESELGPDDPDVGTSLNNMGNLYLLQGRYDEAEPLYQRALAITERALGPDHPNVGIHLNNLATLYQAQRRYKEAEQLYARALAITETALGPAHPSVGIRLNNLAALYRGQRRYEEAEQLYARALAITETAFGSNNPSVGIRLNNLAELYRAQGRHDEAEPLYERAVQVFSDALGEDHPYTVIAMENLASLPRE